MGLVVILGQVCLSTKTESWRWVCGAYCTEMALEDLGVGGNMCGGGAKVWRTVRVLGRTAAWPAWGQE